MHLIPFSCKKFNNGQKYSYTEETHAARLELAVNNRSVWYTDTSHMYVGRKWKKHKGYAFHCWRRWSWR